MWYKLLQMDIQDNQVMESNWFFNDDLTMKWIVDELYHNIFVPHWQSVLTSLEAARVVLANHVA